MAAAAGVTCETLEEGAAKGWAGWALAREPLALIMVRHRNGSEKA